jgi:heparosan-N-sulfate-glucuronate 5-epimerase
MELDARGIPVQRARTFGETYNPAYIAWFGLVSLERWLRGLDPDGADAFSRQAEWLVAHAVHRDDGAVVWPYTFDFREGRCRLQAPWICAMAQGLAMSVLVRAHRMTGRQELLDLCHAATRVFEKNVEDGGVRTFEHGHTLYEEYPAYPLPRVLDGFLFSLLGLHDLAVESDEARVGQMLADGVAGLAHSLEFWDYRGKWSWYGSHGYLCPPHYNKLNVVLLSALGRLCAHPTLLAYAEKWTPQRLALADRLEVFAVFTLTKNLSRLRRRTWRR